MEFRDTNEVIVARKNTISVGDNSKQLAKFVDDKSASIVLLMNDYKYRTGSYRTQSFDNMNRWLSLYSMNETTFYIVD